MGRSRTITNEQILEAARSVFLQDGFSASTVEIARRAGISEASIFKRFSTKENLFFAALGISTKPEWINDLKTLPGQGDLKENLIVLSLKIIDFFRDVVPRMMLIVAKGKLPPMLSTMESCDTIQKLGSSKLNQHSIPSVPPIHLLHIMSDLKALTDFFEHELKLGRIRPSAPDILAHMFLGSLIHYTLTYQILSDYTQNTEVSKIPAPVYVQKMIDAFWDGIAPKLN